MAICSNCSIHLGSINAITFLHLANFFLAILAFLASQQLLISSKLARIFASFLDHDISPHFGVHVTFRPPSLKVKKRGVITCKAHVAGAYRRPHRSVCVESDLAIRNTAHRPFKVRTLPVTAARVFSPSPLPVTSLFTSLLLLCRPLPPPPPHAPSTLALPCSSPLFHPSITPPPAAGLC